MHSAKGVLDVPHMVLWFEKKKSRKTILSEHFSYKALHPGSNQGRMAGRVNTTFQPDYICRIAVTGNLHPCQPEPAGML